LTEKHIGRKRKHDDESVGLRRDLTADDDEWSRITTGIGEKIEDVAVMDVQDRSITFNKNETVVTKEEDYKEKNEEFKDHFGTTAQYVKFVNAHLAAKKSNLDKLKREKEQFEKEIAALKPEDQRTKADLDLLNYKEIKSDDVRNVLSIIQKEQDEAKAKVEHFSTRLNDANEQFSKKNKQMEEVKSELASIKIREEQNVYKKEEEPMKLVKNELSSLGSSAETEKIYGAINSLVVLLNSKNQETLNELNSMKDEFSKMKKDYDKAMKKLDNK
jgi:chromosome segregation protein